MDTYLTRWMRISTKKKLFFVVAFFQFQRILKLTNSCKQIHTKSHHQIDAKHHQEIELYRNANCFKAKIKSLKSFQWNDKIVRKNAIWFYLLHSPANKLTISASKLNCNTAKKILSFIRFDTRVQRAVNQAMRK